jgi:hypothetical protein
MESPLATAYLRDTLRTYRSYKALGEGAISQVRADADLHTLLDSDSNSIAIIVKHVAGNLRSRFRDFLTADGEKPDRDRDGEFEMTDAVSRQDILEWWNEGWAVAMEALEALGPEDLERTVYIRGEAFLVVEALNRSVTHTAYHVGQIVYLARHLAWPEWKSLSIPRGKSADAAKGSFKRGAGLPR